MLETVQVFGTVDFSFPENRFFVILLNIRGWDGLYRIDETKLICAISRKFIFDKNFCFGIRES